MDELKRKKIITTLNKRNFYMYVHAAVQVHLNPGTLLPQTLTSLEHGGCFLWASQLLSPSTGKVLEEPE